MTEFLREALARTAALGPLGYAAFVALYAVSTVALLPISVLSLGAGAAFGVKLGFLLVWAGASLGCCGSFVLGRHLLRHRVEERVEHWPKFAAIRRAVAKQGWRVVLLTRLSPAFPFGLINYAYGLTRVTFRDYALASIAGMIPGTLAIVYFGSLAGDAIRAETRARTPAEWTLYGLGFLATVAAVALVAREAKRALKEAGA